MNMDFSLVAHRGLSQLPEEQQIFENHTLRLDYIHALIQDEISIWRTLLGWLRS